MREISCTRVFSEHGQRKRKYRTCMARIKHVKRLSLRGSKKQGAPGIHLLSALAHHVGVTLAQHAVHDKTNEITAIEPILQQLVLEGRIVTMDALLTQRHIAQTIVEKGGDYVMIVKDNEPGAGRHRAGFYVLALATAKPRRGRSTLAMGASSSASHEECGLVGYSDWPGLRRSLSLDVTLCFKTGQDGWVVYGVRACARVGPPSACSLGRGQWQIETSLGSRVVEKKWMGRAGPYEPAS